MAFLPAAPLATEEISELAPPPPVETNIFLHEVPAILLTNTESMLRTTRGDTTMVNADLRYQRGKRLYQQNDIAGARREFDGAIDLMLQASAESPADRLEYDRKLSSMVDAIHRHDLSGMGASADVEEGKFEKAPLEDILEMTFPVDPRLKDKVREQLASTVSQLPLSVNDTVLGYINYFSNRGRGTIRVGTQRSGRYRGMILRILDEEGIPQELIHLAQAESGFIPRAMSRKAAGGMWQFLKWRGNEYGLRQTAYTDERMDPEKATRAAARHLRDLYIQFGDWYLAVAAYNCGPGTVEKAVERTGFADFWELRRRGVLPAETTNYVPIILAMTIMEKNPAEYGLEGLTLDPAIEYDTVEMSAPTSMTLLADLAETSPAEMAVLNPAVLKSMVPAGFPVHVPKGTGNQLIAALEAIPAEGRKSWRVHRVSYGDTLATIGKRYGASASSILSANRMETAEAAEGDVLMIPAAPQAERPTVRAKARSTTRRASTPQSRAKQPAKPPARAKAPAAKPRVIAALR